MGKYPYIFLMLIAALTACTDGMYDNSPDGPLELSLEKTTVGKSAVKINLGVTARDGGWTMSGAPDWMNVDPESGPQGVTTVVVSIEANLIEEGEEGEDQQAETRTATLVFSSGGETKELLVEQLGTDITPPIQSPEYEINKRVREELLDEWYYNGETRDTDADYNQKYNNFYNGYLSTLTRNLADGNVWTMTGERYLYSYIERDPGGLNYGMEFDLGNYDGKLVGRIMYVYPGSPAATAGLKRGDWFWKVNDIRMENTITKRGWYQYNERIDSLVKPVEGFSPELGMLTFQPFASRLIDEGRTVSITPARFSATNSVMGPVQLIQARNRDQTATTYTGYIALNNLEGRFRQQVVDSLAALKAKVGAIPDGLAMNALVLDLRYSKTGTAKMAETVANLIVPAEAEGRVFASYKFAEGQGANDAVVNFSPQEGSLGAKTIFILTSNHTTGAAELLINALRGIEPVVKLVLIGNVTEGMNTGMVNRQITGEVADSDGTLTQHTYDVWMAAFRCYNDKGAGSYEYGFTPNGATINEWSGEGVLWSETWGWKGWIGATEDPLLKKAIDMVTGITPITNGSVLEASTRQRGGLMREFSVKANMLMNDE